MAGRIRFSAGSEGQRQKLRVERFNAKVQCLSTQVKVDYYVPSPHVLRQITVLQTVMWVSLHPTPETPNPKPDCRSELVTLREDGT